MCSFVLFRARLEVRGKGGVLMKDGFSLYGTQIQANHSAANQHPACAQPTRVTYLNPIAPTLPSDLLPFRNQKIASVARLNLSDSTL